MTRRSHLRRNGRESALDERPAGHLEAPAALRTVETRGAPPRAILVAVASAGPAVAIGMDEPWDTASSLDELATLATAAGIEPVRVVSQRLRSAHPRTYLGEGKAQYVADLMRAEECDLVLADDELTPTQQKGLEAVCGAGRVVDRTALILEIFGQRARTHEGMLQVQLAQARYGLPRLARLWTHLERQRGGTSAPSGATWASAWRWLATPMPASRRSSTGSHVVAPRSPTSSLPRSTPRRGAGPWRRACRCCSPIPWASSTSSPR